MRYLQIPQCWNDVDIRIEDAVIFVVPAVGAKITCCVGSCHWRRGSDPTNERIGFANKVCKCHIDFGPSVEGWLQCYKGGHVGNLTRKIRGRDRPGLASNGVGDEVLIWEMAIGMTMVNMVDKY